MAGDEGGRTLEETPTWAVAVVCSVLLSISIIIEFSIHLTDKWLTKRNRSALCEALEKIKSEFMLLGFISLLLTIGQGTISDICISKSVASTWHPCERQEKITSYEDYAQINGTMRRVLASGGTDKCAEKGKVPLVSVDGIHQLHIFIFVLAIFHVLYCIATCALGTMKMKKWKAWEMETKTSEYQFANDPERFRFARDTSFGRRHLNFWSRSTVLMWMVCFVRQFIRSVPKVDYLTLRYGFIIAHLAPQSQANFDFQKYINRSLEEDFKVVVGISPPLWFFAVLFLLFNTQGLKGYGSEGVSSYSTISFPQAVKIYFIATLSCMYNDNYNSNIIVKGSRSYIWLPFAPFIIILLVGTKLQVAITKMGLRIQERGEVVKGTPVVQPDDHLFWFNRPRVLLYLVHFVFFQNAFQLAFYLWSWYEFGAKSCFHQRKEDVIIRVTMGVVVLFLCGYVILPLYALVTQMGSTMKPTIFNEKVAKALRTWHNNARKQIIKQQKHPFSSTVTPLSSQPGTPVHGSSPIHLQHHQNREIRIVPISPRIINFNTEPREAEVTSQLSHHHVKNGDTVQEEINHRGLIQNHNEERFETGIFQHEVDIIQPAEFSFENSKV